MCLAYSRGRWGGWLSTRVGMMKNTTGDESLFSIPAAGEVSGHSFALILWVL